MASYSFPVLEVGDLVKTMKEIIPELDINDTDFSRPKRERWETIYQSVLANTTHCSMETLFQPQLDGMDALDHVELYEKVIPVFHLLRAMQKLMTTCFFDDFNIDDIINPKPNRQRKLCSALVNFMRFQTERMDVLHRIKEESEAMIEQRELLLKENDELKQQINQLKAARSQRQPEINQLKEEISAGTERLNQLQQVVGDKKSHCDSVKTDTAQNKAKLAKIKENIAVAKEESNRLSGLIVQSPERMKTDMDRMHQQLAKLKRDKDEKINKLVDIKRTCEQLAQRQTDCEQALKLLTDISEQSEADKKVLAEIGNVRDQAQGRKEQLANAQMNEKQQRRILTGKQEKLAKMTLQHEGKVNSLKDDIALVQEKIAKMKNIHSAEVSEVAKIQAIQGKLSTDEQTRLQAHHAKLEQMGQKYSELLQQLDAYHNRLGESWEGLKSSAEQ